MKLEDLKVGQYVRFKDKRGNAYIRNIKEVYNEQPHKSWGAIIIDKNANNVPYVSLKHIKKASYSIIDILEERDYVNGYPICEIVEYENDTRAIVIDDDNKSIIWESKDIKSVITHEQMEQMAYKVEE